MNRTELLKLVLDIYTCLSEGDFVETTINVAGLGVVNVLLGGNDEMFDLDEFYQLAITNDKVYELYFDLEDENGQKFEDLCNVDYDNAYKYRDVTSDYVD